MKVSPIDEQVQKGLKVQAKLSAFAILNSMIKGDHPPIATEQIKGLADVIYTCLYSFQYGNQSASAEEFLKFHADELRDAEWEPELICGVG